MCRIGNPAQTPLHARFDHLAAHQVGEADDGIQRCADFVAHVGQEGTFGAAGALGLFLGDGQFIGPFFHHRLQAPAVAGEFGLRFAAFGDVGGKGKNMAFAVNFDQRCRNVDVMDQPAVILPDGFVMQDAACRLDGVDKFVAQMAIGPEADFQRGSAQHFFPFPAEITQIVFIDVNDQPITDPCDRGRKRAGVESDLEALLFRTPCRLCLKQYAIAPHPYRLVDDARGCRGGSEQADDERNNQVRRCLPLGHRFIARHFGNQVPGGFGN